MAAIEAELCARITSVWSTPKNSGNEARKIRRVVDNCTARKAEAERAEAAKEDDRD